MPAQLRAPRITRILIAAALLVAVLWGLVHVRLALRQAQAVAVIRGLGGKVTYDFQCRVMEGTGAIGVDPAGDPWIPATLRQLLGDDFFGDVVFVDLRGTPVTDANLHVLREFPNLEVLDLVDTRIDGSGLVNISDHFRLRGLSLWKTNVDDESLRHLAHLTALKSLVLDETRVTDAGLVHLRGLTNLEEWLGLTDTGVTDAGLTELTGFTLLRNLNLRRTAVTASGVRALQRSLPHADISYGA